MKNNLNKSEKISISKKHKHFYSSNNSFSNEEMARDWTLNDSDKIEIEKYRKIFRPFVAVQIISVRILGRFIADVGLISPKIINYLNKQLDLPPSLSIISPERGKTYQHQRKNILKYLGFKKFNIDIQNKLELILTEHACQGVLPSELFLKAETFLLKERFTLPGITAIDRIVIKINSKANEKVFKNIYLGLSPILKKSIDEFLKVPEDQQRTYFYRLKEYPPSAKISSLKSYLRRYYTLEASGINNVEENILDSTILNYLYKQAKYYSASDLKRFKEQKRYSIMIAFMLESRKILLDHLVKMHDQYIIEMIRESKNIHEKKHREFRKRQKNAIDTILDMTDIILNWPSEQSFSKELILQKIGKDKLQSSIENLHAFKYLEECGYGNLLIARYPSLRKYFSDFIKLPFAIEPGSESLLKAIQIVLQLDNGLIKTIPLDCPTSFIPRELLPLLKDINGKINRNAWELGLAIVMKDSFRSGDLYLPKSKQHTSFWNLLLSDSNWKENKTEYFKELNLPEKNGGRITLIQKYNNSITDAKENFNSDKFAEIQNGKLCLKRDDKVQVASKIINLQKAIDASMPSIRIEQLLMEVDKQTGFSRHFVPISKHGSRPHNYYKTLIATIISQATNLGVMSMSASVKDVSVDKLRHLLQHYIRDETIKAASAEIVNKHHQLPLSSVHGNGTLSSSDAQRFKIRADSLLASYYPRYYGYYEKAIGLYTHVSDQYSVFSTKVISCSPREALYVLDGLLENNTILKIREHTTDTHGYTEIIFALCHLLGIYFMPRIKDLKDQQLYRIEKKGDNGVFSPLLNKTVDMDIIEEQWESMVRVAISLKKRTAPAHVIVQRLSNSSPSDRLSKAFTNLGRLIKTEYILRYITDPVLRRTVQLQLNKGEYRHKLPRWIFFANQGEFDTGDYEEIMNKASCLSLVSNAILYWNTTRINTIVESLRINGEIIEEETLSHISLLPFKHILPNGTYFIE